MGDTIKSIRARQVLDSRGNPTVEAEVLTEKGKFFGIVPSGASTGTNEALEMRDGGNAFKGKAVTKAVGNVNNIISGKIVGMDCTLQEEIDKAMIELDGTENKDKLGANSILAVSMAVCRAGAVAKQKELFQHIAELSGNKGNVLPLPQMNVMNGGKHAGLDEDIQEQMIVATGAKTYSEAVQASVETYHTLKGILKKKFGAQATLIGDEGGFVPKVSNVQERLDLMNQVIEEAGYKGIIELAIDSASSEFFSEGKYKLYGKEYSPNELVDFYANLIATYSNIVSLEDGMAEEDWEGWKSLTGKIGNKIQIVGDDLLVTNPKMIERAISEKSCNALLLKINQIGTITESIEAARKSKEASWGVVVSHRSGETEDSLIADFLVGIDAGQSKLGAPARSERNAKYNQLLRIEEILGENAQFPGKSVLRK
ncbi:MAG: phosphopyruvate hydratase [Candidatus Diapherotrites archaeon]|uniref:Enolase n=1 Tax=Candidatus Iainarchaeum sp. TaxID=3101447 RepID=A0A2D6LZT6_9ARCH|nr:phosphopyruvate hydratase [Candidatus Diapherotrites archaeon]|tara:strand:+ start:3363 stop:4643 length:1281 start_codon:yes stop_codon:yes gene_type:complete